MSNDLVSVIMASYNCGKYVEESIRSVQAQTYKNWELLFVDDCSVDDTVERVTAMSKEDPRIRVFCNDHNSGAAVSRNLALRNAKGRWIAFLDSDDIWYAPKLEKQIRFMEENGCSFSYTEYKEMDMNSTPTGVMVSGPRHVTKWGMMNFCWVGCLTVMYDAEKVGLIQIADIRKNNDYALWMDVIEKTDCWLLDECLATYRRGRRGSISTHGYATLIKWHYKLWREAEGMSRNASVMMTVRNVIFGAYKKLRYVRRLNMKKQNAASYKDFIRYALTGSTEVPSSAMSMDWRSFYDFCSCQGILGIMYYGIVRADLIVPKRVLFDWCRSVGAIRVMNQNVNECIGKVARLCEKWGYKSCLLKGQANALMYPKPNLRSPGDIDIWLDGDRNEIISRILEDFPKAHYSIHHIKMPLFKKTQVEVHYRPVFLDNWKSDRILQEYIGNIKDSQFAHKEEINGVSIGTLTCEFDVVFQMLHLWHHFFATRNNFKQLIDYYYLLKRGVSHEEKKNSVEMFEKLGVLKYAKGVMWVMQEIFGLEKEYLVVEPDEKVGKLILRETMGFKASSGENISYMKRVFFDNYRFITVFPSEVLVKPFFLLWHQWWKRKMNSSFSTLRKNQVNQEVGCRLCQ